MPNMDSFLICREHLWNKGDRNDTHYTVLLQIQQIFLHRISNSLVDFSFFHSVFESQMTWLMQKVLL